MLKKKVVMKAIIQPNPDPDQNHVQNQNQNPDHDQNLLHVQDPDRVQNPYHVLDRDHRTQRHPVRDQHPSHHLVQDHDLILVQDLGRVRDHDRHQKVLDQFILANQVLVVGHQAEVAAQALMQKTRKRKDQKDLESLSLAVVPAHVHQLLAAVDHELHLNLAAVTANKHNIIF